MIKRTFILTGVLLAGLFLSGCGTENTKDETGVSLPETVKVTSSSEANTIETAESREVSLESTGQEVEEITGDFERIPVTVLRYIDGDTTHFQTSDGQVLKVRYLLIDAPELNKRQPYAKEAADKVREILSNAQDLQLEYDIGEKQDHYGRHLCYVWADGKLVQEALAAAGLVMVRYVYPPNTRYLDQIKAQEQRAMKQGWGVWSLENYATSESGYQESSSQEASEAPQDETEYVDANGRGLIKGSKSRIYHLPNSKYYDTVTNVQAWFKTVKEAEKAGYRAPKG